MIITLFLIGYMLAYGITYGKDPTERVPFWAHLMYLVLGWVVVGIAIGMLVKKSH